MSITHFPNGVSSFGVPMFPGGMVTQGNVFFVKPYSGNDANDGKSPANALKTMARALALCTANQNDTVYLFAESNSASATTDYQSATLDWNKDMCHIIGVCAPTPYSQRSRIGFTSTYVTASNLFTLSADACIIANVSLFAGVADANPTGCLQVTGDKNYFYNCHIAGIGADEMDIAGAYSLYLNGVQETMFKDCRIGLNTVSAGTAANSEILMASTVKNVDFEDCLVYRRIEHSTQHPLVKVAAATSLEEMVRFKNCGFISTSVNYATSNAGVFKFGADLTQGLITLENCWAYNGTTAGKWDVDDYNKLLVINSPTPAADTCGLVRAV